MSRKSTSEPIRVLVDASKASKCDWCGTFESYSWQRTNYGGSFCSWQCKTAFERDRGKNLGACLLFIGLPLALVLMTNPETFAGGVGLAWIAAAGGLPLAYVYIAGGRARKKVPKGSQRPGQQSEYALMRSMSGPMKCPNCDGNIDLSAVSPDMVYHCGYCGASGRVQMIYRGT